VNINVHIERLVLDGLPVARHQAQLVQTAVETELARLVVAHGVAPTLKLVGGATPNVNAPGIQFTSDSSPAELGQKIARAVYGGIER
jgi:hypothetical protein